MSQNKILKAGDLVKCIELTQALVDSGFQLNRLYVVRQYVDGALCLGVEDGGRIALVDDGVLTDYSDHFTRVQCPIVLPKGNVS